MLSAEEAAARLGALGDDGWIDAARKRITGLDRAHRQHAVVFVEPAPGYHDPQARERHEQRVRTAAAHLDGLGADELGEVMAALSPGLGPALARWWVDARSHPYQQSWSRFGYRAPRGPHLTRNHRAETLSRLLDEVGPFTRTADPVWLAAWAPFVASRDGGQPDPVFVVAAGRVLAAAIDLGGPTGDEVAATLVEVANGDHPVGTMGRHVIVAQLGAARPEGWDHIGRLLLAAQRQEGLRQSILELADEAHPLAFGRLVDLVVEHDLLRFAAAVRAAAAWLGYRADAAVERIPEITELVGLLRRCLTDARARQDALTSGEAWPTYVGLHAAAMADVFDAVTLADESASHPDADVRAAVVRLLANLGVTTAAARQMRMLDDPDTTVAALALALLPHEPFLYGSPAALPDDTFEQLERLAGRLPAKTKTTRPIGVEVSRIELTRARAVNAMLHRRGVRPLDRILPWTDAMDGDTRWMFARQIGEQERLSGDLRAALVAMIGDRSSSVREQAVTAITTAGLAPGEAPEVEALLTRKASDLRRGCIGLLATQPPVEVVASAERLWAAADDAQRDAACELLRSVARPTKAKGGAKARESVREWAGAGEAARRFAEEGLTDRQRELLGDLVGWPAEGPAAETATAPDPSALDAGLGLYDPARRAPVTPPRRQPRRRRPRFRTDTAARIVSAVDDLAHAHRDAHLTVSFWPVSSQDVLLADAPWLPSGFGNRIGETREEEGTGLILSEVFRSWWAERGDDLREEPALDGLRAFAVARLARPRERRRGLVDGTVGVWSGHVRKLAGGRSAGQLRHPDVVEHVLSWLAADDMDTAAVDECLDAIESAAAGLPSAVVRSTPPAWVPGEDRRWRPDWRHEVWADPWLTAVSGYFAKRPEVFRPDQVARWFGLMRWFDEPVPGAERRPLPKGLLLAAHAIGVATDDDVLDRLLHDHHLLKELTRIRRTPNERYPAALALADRLRDRIVQVELRRGDLPTPATDSARNLASVTGADLAMDLLGRLGEAKLVRSSYSDHLGRDSVHSRLLRVSFPAADDTPERVQALARAAGVGETRLVELAVYAPQWAALVERAVEWPGLEDAVWWVHAHTKDQGWTGDDDLRERWAARSAERTVLSSEDLLMGAVDVDWFDRSRAALGAERWKVVSGAAHLASGGNGHRRAQMSADALLGTIDEDALLPRITKRNQDAVRTLGLVALPDGTRARDEAVQRRYALLREFERGSAKFGNQRRTNERNAVRIAVDNLARTAGYTEPQRFVWAMEAAEAGDLADGPVSVEEDGVTVTLLVTAEGAPDIAVRRGDRKLKAVPAAVRKAASITSLRDRKTDLTRQASRVRAALEAAMVTEDLLDADDLAPLDRHPLLAPLLGLLVFVDETGRCVRRLPDGGRDGVRFVDAGGTATPPKGRLRIAHPVDLVAGGMWVAWQEQLFVDGRRQPFKQVFRELYNLTPAEAAAGPASHRYEGHQIQPRQAMGLFGSRGWLTDRDNDDVSRVFHRHDVVARVAFVDGFLTPAEVELPTLQAVLFTRRGSYMPLPLDAVPPVVFSETMRDLDLVVSVAHAGGVDPEATASTVEMRSALVRETARLLGLGNVRPIDPHVVIEGTLGEYSVHLGSGVVHRRPGGALCIIPVDNQRRGRVFLPFADDDPKTAEILAKVLLLAEDRKIKDPTILEQLHG